jgi:hypothetical protein
MADCSRCGRTLLDCATSGGCERRAELAKRWPEPWGACSGWWGDGRSLKGEALKSRCDVCGGAFRPGTVGTVDKGDSVEWSGGNRHVAHTRCVGAVYQANRRAG